MNTINIKALSEQVLRLEGKVGSIPFGKIPKDYSTTEQDTGLKWVDGKEIYRSVYIKNLPEITQTGNITVADNIEKNLNTISLELLNVASTGNAQIPTTPCVYYSSAGSIVENSVSATFSEGKIIAIHEYTKPDTPSRNPDEVPDEEPETKKATRKKSTK